MRPDHDFIGQSTGTWLASHFRAMTDNDARREALSVWMLEFSVLWAVFPVLDQIVERQPIDVWITLLSVAISLTTLAIGVMLKRGERT